MEQNTSVLHYTIREADRALVDKIAERFWTNPKTYERRYDYSTHAAALDSGEIVGYISTTDHQATGGEYSVRYVDFICVHPEYRRRGIGTALVSAMVEKAKADRVKYLTGFISANETAEAFWQSVGFCLLGSVKAQNGSLCHEFVCRLDGDAENPPAVPTQRVEKAEITPLFDKHMHPSLGEYWQAHVDSLYGVKAVSEAGNLLGLLLAIPLDNGSPYKGWGVAPYIYVDEDAPAGTEKSLVGEMARLAAEKGAGSLCTMYKYREYGTKWLSLGFAPTRPGLLKGTEGEQIVKCGMKIGR